MTRNFFLLLLFPFFFPSISLSRLLKPMIRLVISFMDKVTSSSNSSGGHVVGLLSLPFIRAKTASAVLRKTATDKQIIRKRSY